MCLRYHVVFSVFIVATLERHKNRFQSFLASYSILNVDSSSLTPFYIVELLLKVWFRDLLKNYSATFSQTVCVCMAKMKFEAINGSAKPKWLNTSTSDLTGFSSTRRQKRILLPSSECLKTQSIKSEGLEVFEIHLMSYFQFSTKSGSVSGNWTCKIFLVLWQVLYWNFKFHYVV